MGKKSIELLDRQIQKHKARKKIGEERERQKDLAGKKKEGSFLAKEAKLLPKRIALHKKIQAWRDEFIKSKQFKRLFSDFDDDELVIFWNGWGHLKFEEFGGGWSRLYLEKSGKLRYCAGYKWMATGPEIVLTPNPETAKKFTHKYLKELHNSIKTGKIYKTIAEELKQESNS